MGEFRKPRRIVVALSVLALAAGCSRSVRVPDEGSNQAGQAPFRTTGAADGLLPADRQDGHPEEDGLPFDDAQSIPTGTLLTVRLKGTLTSGATSANDLFEAVVDQPVVIDGNAILPRGTAVVGRVESVRVSALKPERGYVRLALQSLRLKGIEVPVQTASLSARQVSSTGLQASTVRLEDGRRLTFRLMEPVALGPHPTRASR